MAEPGELEHRLAVMIDSNEKYRSRSRSVATLCAAAAGGLAVGLVFAPRADIPTTAQVLGLVTITFLIIATALSLAASAASSYQEGDGKFANLLHYWEIWRIRTQSPRSGGRNLTYEGLVKDAQTIQDGIIRTLSWGLWAASVAALSLIGSLIVSTFQMDVSKMVTLKLEVPPDVPGCPGLSETIQGEIIENSLKSDANFLSVKVSADTCGNVAGATVYFDKSLVAIVG